MGNLHTNDNTEISTGAKSPAIWRDEILDFMSAIAGITSTGEAGNLVATDGTGGITAEGTANNRFDKTYVGDLASIFDGVGTGAAQWMDISCNIEYDGGYKHRTTNPATLMEQTTSSYTWYSAPSASAGATASLTNLMNLDDSGNLDVTSRITAKNNWESPDAGTTSCPTSVATTIFTFSSTQAFYNVYCYIDGGFASSQVYTAGILTTNEFGNAEYTATKTATTSTVSISGSNLQVAQNTGSTQNAVWSVQRVK